MKTKNKSKIIVVGSGFGGIASALRMRALGHDVTIIEKLNDKEQQFFEQHQE